MINITLFENVDCNIDGSCFDGLRNLFRPYKTPPTTGLGFTFENDIKIKPLESLTHLKNEYTNIYLIGKSPKNIFNVLVKDNFFKEKFDISIKDSYFNEINNYMSNKQHVLRMRFLYKDIINCGGDEYKKVVNYEGQLFCLYAYKIKNIGIVLIMKPLDERDLIEPICDFCS